jgi:quercetin dioxygenase-like cupin family protein
MNRPKATPVVTVDNDRARVTRWEFEPGAHTGWHRHELDYVVVPMLDGTLELVDANGQSTFAELTAGEPYSREAGVEHDVINANAFAYSFVEIEMK